MKIGYARVSTKDQNLDMQIEALKNIGCEKIYSEKVSSIKDQPELNNLKSILRKGDVVVVWKLDRLGRSLRQLIGLVTEFRENEVEFVSIQDNMDTTTVHGRLIFNIFASFAEFERELISERTKAGLNAARAKGRVGGRKKGLKKENIVKALGAYNYTETHPEKTLKEILEYTELSKSTYYRYMEFAEQYGKEHEKKRKYIKKEV